MSAETGSTLELGERRVREESQQKCGSQLAVVESLLNSLLDGMSLLGNVTLSDEAESKKHFVQQLYISRSFNSLRCSYKLAQMGYYSQAVMLLRSSLEDLVVTYRCEKQPELVEKLLNGKEERFNFTQMAEAEGHEFRAWWKDKYDELTMFTHPRSPGLQILVSQENQRLWLGPYFDQTQLLAVIHYLLMILIHDLRLFFPILHSKDPIPAEEWAQPSLKAINRANKLISKIAEELDPEGGLAMKEALQAPEEDKTSWEEYKKQRATRVRNKEG